MRTALLPLLALLCACRGNPDEDPVEVDADDDGVTADLDCNDADATAFPGADELCDGVDNDCDGAVDDDASNTQPYYADGDGDGYGDEAQVSLACDAPEGTVAAAGDCDDADPAVHPGAAEADCADPTDYNCDGSVGFADDDGDGFAACEECDDTSGAVHPGAIEAPYDGVDNDCDPATLDDDLDGDGALAASDCDDADPAVHPGATETPYDGVDNDCDPSTADDDLDGDGAAGATDCDDDDADVFPGATEACDGVDQDCNGAIDDDAPDAPTWYADADGDGHGDLAAPSQACEAPAGTVAGSDDCDDADPTTYAGAVEACDAVDNDCDGAVPTDETALRYADRDRDGYGDASVTSQSCDAPKDFVSDATDCDDTRSDVNPGHVEVPGDGVANDCDGDEVPLRAYSVARYSGELYVIDRDTGAVSDTIEGLGELIDVEYGPNGDLYVAVLGSGVSVVPAGGGPAKALVTGYPGTHGLFYDHETDTILMTSSAGVILEIDPKDGAVVKVAEGLVGEPIHTIRLQGDGRLWTTFRAAQTLRSYDPVAKAWTDEAFVQDSLNMLVPQNDGSLAISATNGRIYTYDPHNGRLRRLVSPGGLSYGLCPDVSGDDLLFGDHASAVFTVEVDTDGNGTVSEVTTGVSVPWGCATNVLADMDGDGHDSRRLGGPDCDDADRDVNPDASDVDADGVDQDCDGVDGPDGDGDGNADASAGGSDCDDSDAAVVYGRGCGEPADCGEILERYPRATSGTYRVTPPRGTELPVYCEMGLAGGGWTLIANRRENTVNVEACGGRLMDFFTAGCGSPDKIGKADSYALSAAQRKAFDYEEQLLVQWIAGKPDLDDAYVVTPATPSADLFPNTNAVQQIPLAQACDLWGGGCDTTKVFWKYIGDYWYHSSMCFSGSSGSAAYRGNYGLCHNDAYDGGNASTYNSSSFVGNRSEYQETKLWAHPSGSASYQERIFVR